MLGIAQTVQTPFHNISLQIKISQFRRGHDGQFPEHIPTPKNCSSNSRATASSDRNTARTALNSKTPRLTCSQTCFPVTRRRTETPIPSHALRSASKCTAFGAPQISRNHTNGRNDAFSRHKCRDAHGGRKCLSAICP